MPLTAKGTEILTNLQKEYGEKKGESVLYAGKNSGRFTGIDAAAETEGEQKSEDARMSAIEKRLSALEVIGDAVGTLTQGAAWVRDRCDAVETRIDAAYEAAYERDLKDEEPRIVSGVKGMKSTSFQKKFPNQKAMERWMDSEEAGNYSIQRIEKAR